MTIYYVDPSATAGTKNGLTKENAFLSLTTAFAVATGAGDEIRCAHDKHESLAQHATYLIAANNLSVVSWNFTTDVKESGFALGHFSQPRSIAFNAAATPGPNLRVLRIYGISFIISGTTAASFNLFTATAGITVFWESCTFNTSNTNTSCRVNIGGSGEAHGIQFFIGCSFLRFKAAQVIVLGDHLTKFINCEFHHIYEAAYGAVFNGLEQGPDAILEDCFVYGRFDALITATSVTGTRAVRMVRGEFSAPFWPFASVSSGETGLWGFEREFVDVTATSWDEEQTVKYSALFGPGRAYEFAMAPNVLPENLQMFLAGIYVSGALAASDYAAFARPITTLRAKQADDSIPSFWRFYIVHINPESPPAGSLCVTASLTYEGFDGDKMVRRHAHSLFEPDNFSPTLVLDPTPPAEIAAYIVERGAGTAYYFDVPASWLTRGSGILSFPEHTSWELAVKVHLRNGFSCFIVPAILPDGVLPEGATVRMEGGCFLQTIQPAGGGGYPSPIPGYKAVEIIDGKLTQVDVTLNEPPTGTPAVWDGTALRSLLPGESVVLQNP